MKIKNKTLLPMNIQFFAEDPEPVLEPELEIAPEPSPEPTPPPEQQETVEEQLAKVMEENKRFKAAMDKATAEAAENKRKLREKMTETERLNEEKLEREAAMEKEYQQLKRENSINKMTKSFLALGYTEQQAEAAATSQLDGDFESFVYIQKEVQTSRDKINLANYMKNQPVPPAGNDKGGKDPFLAGFDA